MERRWETWQGRLPQELRLAGITTIAAANQFLQDTWLPFHNRSWTVVAAGEDTAFVPYTGGPLERIGAVQHERVVGADTCVEVGKRHLQIAQASWRYSFAKCRVTVYAPLDGTLSVGSGPHTLGRYDAAGRRLTKGGLPWGGTGRMTAASRHRDDPGNMRRTRGGPVREEKTGQISCSKNRTS